MNLMSHIEYVYGPYERKSSGRKIIHVKTKESKRVIPYPKFLVEVVLHRELDPISETVDHIDQDFNNNNWDNLRLVGKATHAAEDKLRVQVIKTKCAWCDKPTNKTPSQIRDKVTKGNAGPFCSKHCVGKYSTALQNRQLPKLVQNYHCWGQYTRVTPVYYTLTKGGETIADMARRLRLQLPTEEDILTALPRREPREPRIVRICAVCGSNTENNKYCSSICSHKSQQRVHWPAKEVLQQLVWNHPTTYIAKKLGVSDNAVAKRCRKFGIDKPPRGYWNKKRTKNKRAGDGN